MNKKPFFSIVIPTYNRAHLILKTFEYVHKQTYTNYEIIIVDDNSTDNTKEVLQPLIDEGKIKFIKHDKNYERSKSRNTGIEKAKGDFLTLLDSDDIIFPTYFEDAAKFINDNPDIHFFHNLRNLVDEKGNEIYKYRFPKIGNTPEHLVYGNYLSCNGVFISKEIYSKYRFDETLSLTNTEDYEFWLRIAAKYKLGRIEKYNSAVMNHVGRSIVEFKLEETIAQGVYIVNKFKKNKELDKVYRPFYSKLLASFYIFTAVLANQSQRYSKALYYLKEAFKIEPLFIFKKRFLATLFYAIFKKE